MSNMGFFNNIKSLFNVDSAGRYDPAGRYLAFVIKAVADQNEAFLPTLFGIKKNTKWSCDTEYCFHDGKRRADLAIYEDGSEEPAYLVEIKVWDNKDNDHTHGQFNDYKEWAGIGNMPKVFIISPFGLADAQMQAISDSRKALKLIDLSSVAFDSNSELVTLFVEYLMEAGYIMKKLEDSRASAFTHFLISAFLPHRHGLGNNAKTSAERVEEGPLVFADIVSNFQLFAQTFPSTQRKPTVQYSFEQSLKTSRRPKKDVVPTEYIFKRGDGEKDSNIFSPQRQLKVGGKLLIFAYCPLESQSGYLEIGIWIEIVKGNEDNPVTYGSYASVYKGKEFFAYEESVLKTDSGFPRLLSSQQEAIKEFRKLAKKLVAKLKKSKLELVSNVQKRLPPEWFD